MTRGRRQSWRQEHERDVHVRQARAEGYRSRAAYKLLEIDAREGLLAAGRVVVDLGAAPGGWSQVAARKVGAQGLVVAVDILPMDALGHVHCIRGDFGEAETITALEQALAARGPELILSDMAPNLGGIRAVDAARSADLAERALAFCATNLGPGGDLVLKVFQGAGFNQIRQTALDLFRSVRVRKPSASRSRSPETYLVGKGFGL